MRQALWDRGVVPHICCHMTNGPFAPTVAWVDVMLDGEWQYQSPPDQRDFLDVWPPDRMRVNHIGKWHVIPRWLGWTRNPPYHLKAWTYRHGRAWTANLALHDIDWLFWGPYSTVADASELRIREPETVFLPYWGDGRLARHEHKGLYVCAWNAPAARGKPAVCTVLLVNAGEKRIDPATVRLDTSVMGLGADPDGVVAEDVDPSLLDPSQYGEDPTVARTPGTDVLLEAAGGLGDKDVAGGLDLGEKESYDLKTAAGRRRHPDYRFTWSKGVLRCAVRRHDYRLFHFALPRRP
jgi:hypothetical protein